MVNSFMMPEIWIWNHKSRVTGLLLGVAFHVAMFAWAVNESNAQVGGYRWLFTWYMPAMVLGFPWSIPAMFLDVLVPSGSVLGLIVAVCFNGYLLGWPVDAIANHTRRQRQSRIIESYLRTTPSIPQQV